MSRTGTRPRVLIVGAGLAGTATAIRLLCFARRPLEIVLLERRSDYRSAGVAYHRDGNPWDYVFNIQAGRMSVFREDVLDFVHWANHEADRSGWPEPWAGLRFVEQGPAPRRIFQDYLSDRLAEARREALPGVVLVEAEGEAVDLEVRATGADVTIEQRSGRGGEADRSPAVTVLRADQVVLATGLELREPVFASEVRAHASFVRDPYSAAGIRKLVSLPSESTVAIVGSVLSAYDSAGLLLRQGHTGRIHLISRTGTMFRTYPGGHEHGVLRLPCPKTLLEPYRNREEFLVRIRAEWDTACSTVVREHPDVSPVVVAERVVKAWEPHLPEAIERIPTAELRGLLDEFGTALAALRVGVLEYTMAVIESALHAADGAVRLVVGKVEAVRPAGSGRLAVSVASPQEEHTIEADLVVSNFGRESDYSRVDRPLWRNLLRRGIAEPHARTGRGLEVDGRGVLLSPGGVAGPVSAVGALREGDEIVRNGRTGAFTFNLAAIKNHSIAVAAHVIEQLEVEEDVSARIAEWSSARTPEWTPVGSPARSAAESTAESTAESVAGNVAGRRGGVGNLEEAARGEFEDAVVLEARRLASRGRLERNLLDSRLDACIRSMGERPAAAVDAARYDRLMRVVVNRAAVERLTDVSVTPRQLRRQLGMATAEEQEE
ncbi:FAD/NAD(P)-binding protein [Kitasatospora sp. NPDC054795]